MKNSGLTVVLTLSITLLAFGPSPTIGAARLFDEASLRKDIRESFTHLKCPEVIDSVTSCALQGAKYIEDGNTGEKNCADILGAVGSCYEKGVDNCPPLNPEQKRAVKVAIKDEFKNICLAIGLSVIIIVVIVIVLIAVIALICCLCCCCCNCCRR